ncbi:type II toxin-antitoxin system death-on-curing family toxin [soil metagenome]
MTMVERREPRWIAQDIIMAVHDRQLAEHGGGSGIRDARLLESVLARPVNRWGYGEDGLATLAACYAFGIARNHPFVDGNKRTAWVAARLFLALNNISLSFDKHDAIRTVLALASGELPEDDLASWFRECLSS